MMPSWIAGIVRRGRRGVAKATRVIFGDRVGVALFVVSLLFVVLYWRIGFFINDNWTVANTLANVAHGHLHITEIVYGSPDGNHPGMHLVDGKLYGRNYGLAFLALPILWVLQLLSTIVSIPIVIAAAWSIGVIWLLLVVGDRFISTERARILSGVVGVTVFAGNVVFAQPIDPRWYPLMALQILTMLAAGLLAVLVYRVLSLVHDRRTGAVLGLVLVVGTPVGFWASIPKRHVVIAALAMLSFYGFARSRQAGATNRRAYRAVSYAAVGLSAWVFPAEAVILFIVLAPLDVLTSPSNSARELAVIGTVFFISLLPAFLTNYMVAGNPLEPPKLWPRYNGEADVLAPTEPNSGTGSGSSATNGAANGGSPSEGAETPGGSRLAGIATLITGLTVKALTSISDGVPRLVAYVDTGLDVVITEPDRLYHVFIRSGWLEMNREYGINLSVLETAPIVGALFALPVIAYRSMRDHGSRTSGIEPTDAFALGYVVLLSLLYLHRLPLHATVTVRYLVPILPFAVYGIGRVGVVRYIIDRHYGPGLWTYVGTVVIGSQVWLLWLIVGQPLQGEAMQLHAIIGFVVGILLGLWAILRYTGSYTGEWQLGSLLVGLSIGVATVFLLHSGLIYAQYGGFALGMVDILVDRISVLVHTVVSGALS